MSSIFRNIKEYLLQQAAETEFDVASDNFADLEIREANGFYYFYDAGSRRLIKDFVLRRGPRVDTLCGVLLVRKEGSFTPRMTFWKKDKTKGTPDTLTESELVTEGRTILVKAKVDVDDCYTNFWRLIDFLRAYDGIEVMASDFRVTEKQDVEIAKALEGHDKSTILEAVRAYLGSRLTEEDIQMLLDRRATLERFERLLTDLAFFDAEAIRLSTGGEGVWQNFFEENTWIFGYGLTLLACESFSDKKLEQITTGSNVFTGGGKRSDALMRTKGFIQTLLFAEIKKHSTPLLMSEQYRKPDVYQASKELSGAVSQVQKTAYKATTALGALHRARTPEGRFQFDVSTIRPRQVVIIGDLSELIDDGDVNLEKMTSFELYRRDHQSVEILTFDELFARAKYIVESQESSVRSLAS
jgi:hypothetical protein